MKVSMKVDYGVRALVDLAQHHGGRPIQTSEIAARRGIPEPYLDQVLTTLRKAGLISSRRGPQGGHTLARPPEDIHLGEIITILEGSMAPIGCVEKSSECALSSTCATREVWRAVKEATAGVLDATSIGQLAARQVPQEAASYNI